MAQGELKSGIKAHGIADRHTEWDAVWKLEDISRIDYLSQVIFNEIKAIAGDFQSKSIAELGSGSGRVSRMMSQRGAEVFLLDMNTDILRRSREEFSKNRVKGEFIAGRFPFIPLKDRKFNIVWNAGVIEHFSPQEMTTSLSEMARICCEDGFIITLNPYRGSLLHTLGTKFMIKHSDYPYKDERPLERLENIAMDLGFRMAKKEYTTGFFLLFVGMFKRLSLFPAVHNLAITVFWAASDIMRFLDRSFVGPLVRFFDRCFSRVFGGYLLVSVFYPTAENRETNQGE